MNTVEKEMEENIMKPRRFEEILIKLSSQFINLPSEQVDQKIHDGLKLISKQLDIDRIAFLQFSEDTKKLYLTHSYATVQSQRAPNFLVSDKLPWFSGSIKKGKTLRISKVDEMPEEAVSERQYVKKHGIKAFVTLPLKVADIVVGAISYSSMQSERTWSDYTVQRLKLVNEIFANALDRKLKEQHLQKAYHEIKELKEQFQRENFILREEFRTKQHYHKEFVGQSQAIQHVLTQIEQVAQLKTGVLVLGETGTGKELVANKIHNLSPRRNHLMIKVNCGSLTPTLIESELFGREAGAYTGAVSKQIGRFEAAHKSTIFLDEIAELPLELQVKLLRVLQEGKFERLGSTKTIVVDVRVVAATNQNLLDAVNNGKFRRDLYYRLNVFPISVPPLRERREDIPQLVWHFIKEFEKAIGKNIEGVTERSMKLMQSYSWPGNIRELRNILERAIIINKGPVLKIDRFLFETEKKVPQQNLALEDITRHHILQILESTKWQVGGMDGAAELLGLKRTTLLTKMKKLNIQHPMKQAGPSSSSGTI